MSKIAWWQSLLFNTGLVIFSVGLIVFVVLWLIATPSRKDRHGRRHADPATPR